MEHLILGALALLVFLVAAVLLIIDRVENRIMHRLRQIDHKLTRVEVVHGYSMASYQNVPPQRPYSGDHLRGASR